MTQSIFLLLEVPSERESGFSGQEADLQRLLARSRLRVVPDKRGGQAAKTNPDAGKPLPRASKKGGSSGPVKSLEEVERDYIVEILSRSGGNRSQAAKMLNISRRTLQRKMARFDGLDSLQAILC